jgi:hypothetical protein
MNAMGSPNWFALTGLLFVACGLALIAKGAIGDLTRSLDAPGQRRGVCQQRVDGLTSIPFMTIGLILLMTAEFYHGELSPPMVLLALSAALGLVLYAGVEGLLVEQLVASRAAHEETGPSVKPVSATKPALSQEQRPALQIAHAS